MIQEKENIPDAKEFNKEMKKASLGVAAEILVYGGPHNRWEKAFVELAGISGNSPEEIKMAALEAAPKIVR